MSVRAFLAALAIIAGAAFWAAANAETVNAADIQVSDGDTVVYHGHRWRLVGFDTPETRGSGRRHVSAEERGLGEVAADRLRELLASGRVDLTEVQCSCPASTLGTKQCNHGRKCGVLKVNGQDVGKTLISEGLALPIRCYATRCERMPDWTKIINEGGPHPPPQH